VEHPSDCCLILGNNAAGGYDAIYLLVVDLEDSPAELSHNSVISEVEAIWHGWKELSVCPLSSRADAGGLKVVQNLEDVKGLKTAVEKAFI
jgi:hypothetical protein